ncbi:hypothetical protein PTKIN_Ptkin10aG0046400 [Pterospermum kingtungense]
MDELMKQVLRGEIFLYETSDPVDVPPAASPSAFVTYSDTPRIEVGLDSVSGFNNGMNSGNMNKRMIEFLRKSWITKTDETKEKERCFRHMMNERMRREKQKQCYFALHSKLPLGTKKDKNSIVQSATKRVQDLQWLKKDLERRNYELLTNLGAMNKDQNNQGTNIRVKIDYPKSGIDSMLEVLKCLKILDSKPRTIHSKFTNQQFLAVMDIETKVCLAFA